MEDNPFGQARIALLLVASDIRGISSELGGLEHRMHAELLDDQDFAEAPDDPSLAFTFLEGRARSRMREAIAEQDNGNSNLEINLEYITAVLSIGEHFKISGIDSVELPNPGTFTYQDFLRTSQLVTAKVYQIKAARAERQRRDSVILNDVDKIKLNEKVRKLRDQIIISQFAEKHKSKLLSILLEFEQELIKPRTNFAKFLQIGMILAVLHGAAGGVEDVGKLYDGALKILGVAKSQEDEMREPLQLPQPQKQLGPPKISETRDTFVNNSKEDIPY